MRLTATIHACDRCGVDLSGRHGKTKFCGECRVVVGREQSRRDVKAHAQRHPVYFRARRRLYEKVLRGTVGRDAYEAWVVLNRPAQDAELVTEVDADEFESARHDHSLANLHARADASAAHA